MRLTEVEQVLAGYQEMVSIGYVVEFYWDHGAILGIKRPSACVVSDVFPDVKHGESPFATLKEAQTHADAFGKKLGSQVSCVKVKPLYHSIQTGYTTRCRA